MNRPGSRPTGARWTRHALAALLASALSGCASLLPTPEPATNFYSLDDAAGRGAAASARATALTLIVNSPHAAAGFDRPRMVYLRKPHELEHYQHNQWIDTPARMLAPLMVAALERSGAFRAVLQTPSAAAGELRLDTEVIRLQHEFLTSPSRVRFTLRAHLIDNLTRRVLASRELEAVIDAPSESPYGGVTAASEAVRSVLEQLAAFCADAANALPAKRGD